MRASQHLSPNCRISLCLFGDFGDGACLLSAAERQRFISVHNTLLQQCSCGGQLDPKLVSKCEALGRVIAEVYSTSSEHRRHAARVAAGKYRGVQPRACGKWQAKIKRSGVISTLGTFQTPVKAADAYDDAAFELYGWYEC